jgi:uncharacterized protein involved in outer membrane biogenesis
VIVLAALGVSLVALALAFDWNWLKGPIERRIASSTGRAAAIGQVEGRWRDGPRLTLRDVVVADDLAGPDALFRARELSVVVSPWPLLVGQLRLYEVALTGAVVNLQRNKAGEANWSARGDADRSAEPRHPPREPLWKTIRVGALQLDEVVITLNDEVSEIEARARIDTLPDAEQVRGWRNRIEVSGRFESSRFTGQALTGPVITLRDTGRPFPFSAKVEVARTRLEAEGEIADLLGDMRFHAMIGIAGPSLSTLYPTLPVALPTTPPYRLRGRLERTRDAYRFDDIVGQIGRSDVRGHGSFELRQPRPTLNAALQSDRVALADLGVLIGVPASEAERASRTRVLPNARFDLPRMNAMNAAVTLTANRLVVAPEIPLEDLAVDIQLVDGVLHLRPLKFGFAAGDIVSTIVLDARQRPMRAEAAIDFRRVNFGRLFPTLDTNRISTGEVGAQIRLKGSGQSVAEILGTSSGTVAAAMSGGRISHTVVAAASLDGGKLLPLLLRGDEPVAVRCAAVAMVVEQGVARTQVFVFDTGTARIDGRGAMDLAAETLALEISAEPKEPSILSLRAPINVEGTFLRPRVSVSSGALLRGGAAVALAIVNPLAALLPLIETGPGEDANCAQVLAPVDPAVKQASRKSNEPPRVKAPVPLPGKSDNAKQASRASPG